MVPHKTYDFSNPGTQVNLGRILRSIGYLGSSFVERKDFTATEIYDVFVALHGSDAAIEEVEALIKDYLFEKTGILYCFTTPQNLDYWGFTWNESSFLQRTNEYLMSKVSKLEPISPDLKPKMDLTT